MVETKETTTITIWKSTKDKIDKHKIHRREPYAEVLERILDEVKT